MANVWLLLLRHPLRTLLFSYSFLTQVILVLCRRILLPHFSTYQSLRLQLQRAYQSSATVTFPDLTHRLPVGDLSLKRARRIDSAIPAYLIPGDRQLKDYSGKITGTRKCVALFAHGGGYARGEARMYVNYMERWIRKAATENLDLVFLSVEYPLSTEQRHPAQLNAFIQTYRYLLHHDVDPSTIVFMGDSAGGGLSILSGCELNRLNIPQPAATILISPWIDMSMTAYEGGNPAVETDYFVGANVAVPVLIPLFIGDRSPTSPEINPLYRSPTDLAGLSPQLILVGGGEFALYDSKRWAEICKSAGLEYSITIEWGQLHIYAMGSEFVDPVVRQKTDDKIIGWIQSHLG